MSDFTIALVDIRRATGRGYHAIRSILNKPTALPFEKAKPGPHGGNSERRYTFRQLLLRLRSKRWFTQDMEQELCRLDFAARKSEVTEQ